MIRDTIDTLKEKVPKAFEVRPDFLPQNPIENKLSNSECVPFKRYLDDYRSENFPRLYPSDIIRINSDKPPLLDADPELEEEVKDYGTDALGWYKPFHFFDNWGIYIRWRGVSYVAYFLHRLGYDKPIETLIKCAFKVIHSHEYFHFLTEWAASFMELTSLKPLYNHYLKFKFNNEKVNLEEPIANAYALKQINPRAQRRISKLFELQPLIYQKFKSYVSEEKFASGKRKLGAYINNPTITVVLKLIVDLSGEPPWEGLFNAEPHHTCIWEVPLYIIVERRPGGVYPDGLQLVVRGYNVRIEAYAGDHEPPHIHVWIPADSKKEIKLGWPSLEPLKGYPPLTNRQKRNLERATELYRQRIESVLDSIPRGALQRSRTLSTPQRNHTSMETKPKRNPNQTSLN